MKGLGGWFKSRMLTNMVFPVCNPSTQKAEAGKGSRKKIKQEEGQALID